MRAPARLLAVLGAVAVAWLLFTGGPKDVVLEYHLSGSPGATRLEVDVRRGAQVVRHAEFRLAGRGETIVRHAVRLPRGDYSLAWRLATPAGGDAGERPLAVQDDETIVLSLAP